MSNTKATFIDYNMGQLILPMDLSEWIPENHVARLIHEMVEAIDDSIFFNRYKGGGRSAYHPKMMTKIILYAYSQKIYSCRAIEKELKENLPMMWLAAMKKPDFRTINRFRSETMKGIIDPLFEEMIKPMIDQHYITMENYFLDGTKIEANANKYSFVWKKSIVNYEAKLQEKIKDTLRTIDEVIESDSHSIMMESKESEKIDEKQLKEIAKIVEKKVHALEEAIEAEGNLNVKKEQKKTLREIKKIHKSVQNDFLPRLRKYTSQFAIFGDRNSFSKTDPDATFMRMKEDHMKNGQLKPGYNVQLATENQFIRIIADAGYASESNYLYAVEENMESLIPYNTYLKEQSRTYKKDLRHASNWTYIETDDEYICPNNQRVLFKRYSRRTDGYGHTRDFKIYECEDCSDCPLKATCTKAKGNRQVHYNPVYEEMKVKARENLWSGDNAHIYAQRKIEVESVFGHIKGNRWFRRFSLRGLDKVHTEFGIVALAHNLLKMRAMCPPFLKHPEPKHENAKRKIKFPLAFFFIQGLWDSPF